MQSQTFVFHMYNNNNTDLVVTYFYVCVIFNVISRSNRGQITEKWAFLSTSTNSAPELLSKLSLIMRYFYKNRIRRKACDRHRKKDYFYLEKQKKFNFLTMK